MDKEILATMNSFRSASREFYSACSYTKLHAVTIDIRGLRDWKRITCSR